MQKSLVVLKNNGVVPFSRDVKRIHVCGTAADNLGVQCGGWTIDWQGREGELTTGGTTVLEGIRQVAGKRIEVTYTADGTNAKGADAVVVVVGEQPYSEGAGDASDLTLSASQCSLIEEAKKAGVPVCLVILSGRPLELHDDAIASDAIVAAWLPGTEGAGVADVLFGNAPATGTLSFTWPRRTDQHPLNVDDTEYDPLFPYGHGLTTIK